ncbi:MAG: ABC transporter permease [Dehalococcoidales bacterium]|nr:ABC transporter permease [Dehalococcoidales bacterium]
MRNYIIRRVALLIPTFLLLTVLVFLLIRLMPGDVIELMVMQHSHEQAGQTQVDIDAIRSMVGLDKPFMTQYWDWLKGMLHGDLGSSYWTRRSVTGDILGRLPVTFELGFLAFLIAQIVAIPVGILAAIRQDSPGDYIVRSIAILGVAVPSFWLGTMVMVFPSIWWGWSPPERYIPLTEDWWLNLQQFLIPATIIGFGMAGLEIRMLRTTMLDVLRQDYVRTAWSKGLRERTVLVRHVFKNSAIPVVTIIAGQIGVVIGGAVILENIFNLPGMGRLFLDAINSRDYPYITGMNALFSIFGLVMILITDLSYAWLDPRIRYR